MSLLPSIAICEQARLSRDARFDALEWASPPPDLDWDEMALDDPVALDPRAWAAA